MSKLKPWGMFATPDDAKALQDWIECLSGGEKAVAYTAAGMAWNLAAKLTGATSVDISKLKAPGESARGDILNFVDSLRRPKDLRCPQCGAEDDFRVESVVVVGMGKKGAVEMSSGGLSVPYWDEDSVCLCNKCDHTAAVRHFGPGSQGESEEPDDV